MLGAGSIRTVQVRNYGACCTACIAEPRCCAFTFDGLLNDTSGGHVPCFLKDNYQQQGPCNSHPHQKGCVSGIVPGRQPSPVPPPGPHHHPPVSGYNTACKGPSDAAKWAFCDTSLPREQRLADLVSRINISEMGSQLTARESSALERLGIPAYYYGTNALHAFREAPCVRDSNGTTHCPTSFPTPPNYGAAFNRSLSREMGRSFGTELRAMYNARAVHSLDTWSPTINLARDPRWGCVRCAQTSSTCGSDGCGWGRRRTDETPSEDPYVLGQHALHSVLGAQNGPDAVYPMIGAPHPPRLAHSRGRRAVA